MIFLPSEAFCRACKAQIDTKTKGWTSHWFTCGHEKSFTCGPCYKKVCDREIPHAACTVCGCNCEYT